MVRTWTMDKRERYSLEVSRSHVLILIRSLCYWQRPLCLLANDLSNETNIVSMEEFFGTSDQSCACSIELSRLLHGSISSNAVDSYSKERERTTKFLTQTMDLSKWLYPTYSANSTGLQTHRVADHPNKKALFQLISTAIVLSQHDYILMIDVSSIEKDQRKKRSTVSLDDTDEKRGWFTGRLFFE